MANEKRIWTVGHSTRSFVEFVDMLWDSGVQQIVDVRSMPGSRKFPHFNQESLKQALKTYAISYSYLPELGGRRKPRPESRNTAWRNKSFQAYADYMETESFRKGLKELKQKAVAKRTAIMCAEAVWWRCHRALIADELKAEGWKVMHIMGFHHRVEHPYTTPAQVENGELTYADD